MDDMGDGNPFVVQIMKARRRAPGKMERVGQHAGDKLVSLQAANG